MTHDLLLKWIFSKLNLTKEYFEVVSKQIKGSCEQLIKTVKLVGEMFKESHDLESEYQDRFSKINERYRTVIGQEISDPDFREIFKPVLRQMGKSLSYISKRVEIKSELKNLVGNKENYLINELIRKIKFLEIDQLKIVSQINDYKRDYCEYLNKCNCFETAKNSELKEIKGEKKEVEKLYEELFYNNKSKSHAERVEMLLDQKNETVTVVCEHYLRKCKKDPNGIRKSENELWLELKQKMKKIRESVTKNYEKEKTKFCKEYSLNVSIETESIQEKSKNMNQILLNFYQRLKNLVSKISFNELEWKEKIRSTIVKKYYSEKMETPDLNKSLDAQLEKSYFNSNLNELFQVIITGLLLFKMNYYFIQNQNFPYLSLRMALHYFDLI